MKFSISSLVSAHDPYKPFSLAVGLIWESRADTRAIWKMSCNNLLLVIFIANTPAHLIVIKEKLLGTTTDRRVGEKLRPFLPSDKSKNEQYLLEKMITVHMYICVQI
jgi:hypothetical protein